jgi:hypothetical protein
MVELALSEPAGHVPDIGGPEVRTVDDVMRAYLRLLGSRKRMIALPIPGKTARADVPGEQIRHSTLGGVPARGDG